MLHTFTHTLALIGALFAFGAQTMPTPVLTTTDAFKEHLDIPASNTSEDDRLDSILAGVEDAFNTYANREHVAGRHFLESVEATEYYDGTGRELLYLKRCPVTAIDSLYVDQEGYYGHRAGGFAAATEWTIGDDFAPESLAATEHNKSCLRAIGGDYFSGDVYVWPEGIGNIKVVYTAGYSTVPQGVVFGIHTLAALARKGATKGGAVDSETIGRYAYRLLSSANAKGVSQSDADALNVLRSYRELHL